MAAAGSENIFARIVRGEIPCHKVGENNHWLAFLDVNPLSKNHTLIVPKVNVVHPHEVPEDYMGTFGPFLSRVIKTVVPAGTPYNILQNNMRECGQEVMYLHFHIIPKYSPEDGLKMSWGGKPGNHEQLAKDAAELNKRFNEL